LDIPNPTTIQQIAQFQLSDVATISRWMPRGDLDDPTVVKR
jgi:hypothetical protein